MRPPIMKPKTDAAVAKTQESDDVRPLERTTEIVNEIDEALAWHDGDARATIAILLADCRYIRCQIELADRALSRGFVRGWRPQTDRE